MTQLASSGIAPLKEMNVFWRSDGEFAPSMVTDLSRTGAFIRTPRPAQMDTVLHVRLDAPGREICAQAIVRRVVAGQGMAVEFEAMNEDDRARLDAWIKRIEAAQASIAGPSRRDPCSTAAQAPAAAPSSASNAASSAPPSSAPSPKPSSAASPAQNPAPSSKPAAAPSAKISSASSPMPEPQARCSCQARKPAEGAAAPRSQFSAQPRHRPSHPLPPQIHCPSAPDRARVRSIRAGSTGGFGNGRLLRKIGNSLSCRDLSRCLHHRKRAILSRARRRRLHAARQGHGTGVHRRRSEAACRSGRLASDVHGTRLAGIQPPEKPTGHGEHPSAGGVKKRRGRRSDRANQNRIGQPAWGFAAARSQRYEGTDRRSPRSLHGRGRGMLGRLSRQHAGWPPRSGYFLRPAQPKPMADYIPARRLVAATP